MARTRDIKPQFFKNDTLAECDPMARLLFVGLWTLADRDGRLECRPLRIKAELFPYDSCDILELLGQLQTRGFIRIYEADGLQVLEIPKFTEHQRCHPKEPSSELPACEDGQAVKIHGEPCKGAVEPGNSTASCALPSSYPLILPASNPPVACNDPPVRRTRSKPKPGMRWSADAGWEGIEDGDRQGWAKAFPACVLDTELARAHEWLKANPAKAAKSNWRKFFVAWLTRSQDKGGTTRTPGVQPRSFETPEGKAARERREAERQRQTDEFLAAKERKRAMAAAEGRA